MAPRKKAGKKVTFSEENKVFEIPPNGSQANEDEMVDAADGNLTHVVVQLPISADHVENILAQDDMCNPLEYNPKLSVPTAYTPVNFFSSKNDEFMSEIESTNTQNAENHIVDVSAEVAGKTPGHCKNAICFWCCHPVEHHQFGMPIKYDAPHNSFQFFGTFCSLECASAYNFSTHMGSDRAWDVQSWIQIMARNYGIPGTVRPAPSRYTLQMFDGPLTIDEFRKIHKGMARSIMVNIPPLVSMKPQIETINTSFFAADSAKDHSADGAKKPPLRRKTITGAEPKKTLEAKMNLSYTTLSSIIETGA